jgi:uncharacterized protein involved in tolerance to divalent cations
MLFKVKSLHSDELPFISYIKLNGLSPELLSWIKDEIK